jgi:hypothetical protein
MKMKNIQTIKRNDYDNEDLCHKTKRACFINKFNATNNNVLKPIAIPDINGLSNVLKDTELNK